MSEVVFNLEAIKALMATENLGVRGFARKLGLSPSCISRILNGKRKNPDSKVIAAFKQAYPQYSLDYYFFSTQSVDSECHMHTGTEGH